MSGKERWDDVETGAGVDSSQKKLSCRVRPAFPLCFPLSMLINASRPLHNDLRAGNVYTKLKRSRPLEDIVNL